MNKSKVGICLLYPDLLGTYGDGGNAVVLARRLAWRGIDAEVVSISMNETVPQQCHIYLMGGGEDQPQISVTDHLHGSKALHRAVDNGAVVFAVCAGMQVLGESFAVAGEKTKAGLGLLDVTTVRGAGPRRVGELVVQPAPEFDLDRLTGFENHGGITRVGPSARPLGAVVHGNGNDDGSTGDGAVQGKVVATYLHGPAFARNPQLADMLLRWATGTDLQPIDDSDVDALRQERFAAVMSVTSKRRRLMQRLRQKVTVR